MTGPAAQDLDYAAAMADAVCVLGMMRTGTSLVAGILDRLGVHFGSGEQLLRPNRANPTGFWEHRRVIELNDELLARFGGTWHSPPELPAGWESSGELADLRAQARSLIRTELTAQTWGWKDPRSCLTLPFWHLLVPSVRHVICLRHPVEAALSLQEMPWVTRRLGGGLEQGLDLWARYTRDAVEHTEGRLRLVVYYEDLIAGRHREVSRLAAFVGRGSVLDSSEVEAAIRDFVRPARRHQALTDVEHRVTSPHPAERLYATLRSEPIAELLQ